MQFLTTNQCTCIDLQRKQGRYIELNNLRECLFPHPLLQWLIQVAKQTEHQNLNS